MIKLNLTSPWSAPLWFVEQTDSTMNDARQLADSGAAHGTVIATGLQTAGRGRFADRQWLSPPRQNLLFTLLLKADQVPASHYPLSLRLGWALVDFVRDLGLPARLKWPNDLIIRDQKSAGILVIGRQEFYHIGIGLNVNQDRFEAGSRLPPTSLLLQGRPAQDSDPLGLLSPLLQQIDHTLQLGDHVLEEGWKDRLWGLGQVLTLRPGSTDAGSLTGIFAGVGPEGEALLETDQGLQSLFTGE